MKKRIIKTFPYLFIKDEDEKKVLIDALLDNINRKIEDIEKQENLLSEKEQSKGDENSEK